MIPTTRATNMERRRQRILAAARKTLAREGFDALTLRSLAREAGVTVPTIYNLVGSKDDLLRQLMGGLVQRCEEALEEVEGRGPIERIEHVFGTLTSLFAEDADFCRAALLAGQRIERSHGGNPSPGIWQRSSQIAQRICRDASDAGLLRGELDPVRIGERAYDSYRIAAIDWMNGEVDVQDFERNTLMGFYLCLAADAVPRFRRALTARMAELDASGARRARDRQRGSR